jgi:hypothetical protein
VLAVCALVVAASLFFSRERVLTRNEPLDPVNPAVAETQGPAVSGIAKRSPKPGTATAVSLESAAHPEDLTKARVLDEILKSKNDNDPRLDHEFNALTSGAKALFRARYGQYAPEKRNERGTIVFLLGRNLTSEEDFGFLHDVLIEAPCRSLADCSADAAGSTPSEALHHEMGEGVTLAYPQLVALTSIERYLWTGNPDPSLAMAALRELEAARRSPVARVASLAEDIRRRYSRRTGH